MAFVNPANLWRAGAALTLPAGAVGVITEAFGSHGLKGRGYTPEQIRSWEIGGHYALFNGLALLAISLHPRFSYHRFAGPAIFAGASMFSFTIFGLVLNRDRFKPFGPITPLGGALLILGYTSMIF